MTSREGIYCIRIFVLLCLVTCARAKPIAIRGGTLLTVSTNPIAGGTVLMENGKIQAVGAHVPVPGGAQIIDARDKFILPGLVDAQSSLYVTAADSDRGAPEWNIVDVLDPFIERHEEVLAQGVTAVCVAPSSRRGFAGRAAVLRLTGAKTPAQLVLKADAAVKASIGLSSNNQSSSLARLDSYAELRETLIDTQAYMQRQRRYEQDLAEYEKKVKEKKDDGAAKEKKQPELKRPAKPGSNPTHDILARVLRKEVPLQIEAHRVSDILNALRLAEEFKFSLILDKCTEGYRITEEIARHKVPVIVGPVSTSFLDGPQLEYRNHSPQNAALLAGQGVQTALGVSGRDGLSSKFVTLAAALAVANGMDRNAALRAVTLTPAEIFGVADRIGSLDVGKDADIVIMTAHPFDTASRVHMVLLEGKVIYERKSAP